MKEFAIIEHTVERYTNVVKSFFYSHSCCLGIGLRNVCVNEKLRKRIKGSGIVGIVTEKTVLI